MPRIKHGYYTRSEYRAWQDIKKRTQNPNYKQTQYYRARGIKLCSGWKESFQNFIDDVGDKPTPEHSIDRIDNERNYSCGHCKDCQRNNWVMNVKWSTSHEQVLNRRVQQTKSGYKGVRLTKFNTFNAHIKQKGRYKHIGNFETAIEAAKAYNIKAVELFGDLATLNEFNNS